MRPGNGKRLGASCEHFDIWWRQVASASILERDLNNLAALDLARCVCTEPRGAGDLELRGHQVSRPTVPNLNEFDRMATLAVPWIARVIACVAANDRGPAPMLCVDSVLAAVRLAERVLHLPVEVGVVGACRRNDNRNVRVCCVALTHLVGDSGLNGGARGEVKPAEVDAAIAA